MTTDKDLQAHVDSIAANLTNGYEGETNGDGEAMGAFDVLTDALDIEYTVNGKGEYLGARVLVAFGGPNIWIDTRHNIVDGHWWGAHATASYTDTLGIDDACRELWESRA